MAGVPYIGEIFALAAPICWSFAIILFRKTGETVPALALNLFKNALAMVLFFATLRILGRAPDGPVPMRDYVLLVASGALGIGLADTFFFMTLNRVGAALHSIITTSYSPSIILLSFFFLGERLNIIQVLGVLFILNAVLSVGWMGGPKSELSKRTLAAGIAFGILGTTTQGVSIVMIKPLLNEYPILWANCWRLLGGLVTSAFLLPLVPGRRRALATLRNPKVWRVMIPASVLGTYVSLLFWLAGMKYTLASIASALNQTSTLWTFLLAALLLHEPVTRKRIAGLVAGVVGVALVMFG